MPQSSNLININTSVRHCLLEYLIKKSDTSQDISRSAVFAREVRAAEKVENWNDIQLLLSELKQTEKEFPVFRNLQAKYDEETASILQRVRLKMENDLKDIKVLQMRYMVLLLQMNYYLELKKRQVNSGNNVDESSIDLPEMARIFAEMMLVDKDCQELEEIRQIMQKWKNK